MSEGSRYRKGLSVLLGRNLPSDDDLRGAVEAFRRTGALVFFEGFVGNDGFGGSMSFNPQRHDPTARDYLEIALAEASLTFKPTSTEGWSWSEALKDFTKAQVDGYSVKLATQETRNSSIEGAAETSFTAEGTLGAPILGGMKLGAQQKLSARRSLQSGRAIATETTHTFRDRHVEIVRDHDAFQLTLRSPPGDDLVRLNPELDRLGILSAPEPSAVDPFSVRVTVSFQMKGELRHALRIRDAGGCWQRLIESRNKQIISELLFEKLLKPVCQPLRAWPPKRRRNG